MKIIIENKKAMTVANIVEQTWLTRYSRPNKLTYDRGTEFMEEFARMIEEDYGNIKKGITKHNPYANAIIERIHQTIGNMIRTFEVQEADLDEEEPWADILAAVIYATCATFHTILKATPMQLVFGHDALSNTSFQAN